MSIGCCDAEKVPALLRKPIPTVDHRPWLLVDEIAAADRPGKQTTKTLGLKSEINRRQAGIARDEIIRPINLTFQDK